MGMEDGYACYPIFSDKLIVFIIGMSHFQKQIENQQLKLLGDGMRLKLGSTILLQVLKANDIQLKKKFLKRHMN